MSIFGDIERLVATLYAVRVPTLNCEIGRLEASDGSTNFELPSGTASSRSRVR